MVVFRSSGSVSGKKKLLQFFFAGFLFFREAVVFAFSGLFRLCPIKTFLVKEDELDVVLRLAVAKQMGEMVSDSGVLRRNYRWFRLRRRCLLGVGRGGVTR
ncbi:hypothetical protein HID58_026189 [Brassica napus]|uniref:Uncharacterized protein n=1 Tax=Brassica napus TaxID=3708 RepID=A0ABQ8CNB9_BRANA|nr:hypothetical protein HID58_026189 [Brassica napus]